MEQQTLKPNLRSTVFTDPFREKLEVGTKALRFLRDAGVRVIRTNYDGPRPELEIDPASAALVEAMDSSLVSQGSGTGLRHFSKVIEGCRVVWSVAS